MGEVTPQLLLRFLVNAASSSLSSCIPCVKDYHQEGSIRALRESVKILADIDLFLPSDSVHYVRVDLGGIPLMFSTSYLARLQPHALNADLPAFGGWKTSCGGPCRSCFHECRNCLEYTLDYVNR